jgi:hypothetical protein
MYLRMCSSTCQAWPAICLLSITDTEEPIWTSDSEISDGPSDTCKGMPLSSGAPAIGESSLAVKESCFCGDWILGVVANDSDLQRKSPGAKTIGESSSATLTRLIFFEHELVVY